MSATSPPMPTPTTLHRHGLHVDGADLEHGWSSMTPVDDSIARRAALALAESTARPSVAMGARLLRTGDVVATDLGRGAGYWNAAVVLRPLTDAGWAALAEELSEFATGGSARDIDVWSPFPTPDLRHLGWTLSGHPTAMWRPAGPQPAGPVPDVRVDRVRSVDDACRWGDAAVAWYPLPDRPEDVIDPSVLSDPDVHLFTAWAGGRAVAISSAVVAHGTNAVPFVASRPDARRRGYGAAVTWAATRVRPDLPAVLLASDDGRPVYERMGYLPLARWTLWMHRVVP